MPVEQLAPPCAGAPVLHLRAQPRPEDAQALGRLLAELGLFPPWEIAVALELLHDRLQRGEASDYQFLFAQAGEELAGFCCFGSIAVAPGRFDLYWIACGRGHAGRGVGSRLLSAAEDAVRAQGGRIVFIETSSRAAYAPARAFYRKHAYREVARVPRYYGDGDDRVIYMKEL